MGQPVAPDSFCQHGHNFPLSFLANKVSAPLPYASRCKLDRNWKDENMIEYCTTRELELSPVACVDLLVDLRSDIEGVSRILRAVAYKVPSPELEQMLVCSDVLGCAAKAIEAIKEHLMAEAGMG